MDTQTSADSRNPNQLPHKISLLLFQFSKFV